MNVTCPACSATGRIDESHLPPEGRDITCPRCRHRFHQRPERSGVQIIQQRTMMVCPKCLSEQEVSDTCKACGIVISKYVHARERARDQERLELAKLKSDLREVDSWYSNLFNHRMASLMARILSVLVLLAVGLAYAFNNAKHNHALAEATAAAKKAAAQCPPPRQPDDGKILEALHAFEIRSKDATAQCLSQCERYNTLWRSNNGSAVSNDSYLRSNIAAEVEALKETNASLEIDYQALRIPSPMYQPYHGRVMAMYNLFRSLYSLATEYQASCDVSEAITRYHGEYQKILSDLEEVRPKEVASGGA